MSTPHQAHLTTRIGEHTGGPIPARIFGNFLEHLGYAVDGGILAQALANPTFERDTHLSPETGAGLAAGRANPCRLAAFPFLGKLD